MSKKKDTILLFVTSTTLLLVVVSLSGCTSNQNTNQNMNGEVSKFLGAWTGNMEVSLFGGQSNTSTSITQLTFTADTVEATLTSERGTFSMSFNYTINGDTLTLEPKLNGQGGFPGGQPPNGQWPRNGTRPTNDTWPYNRTRPGNNSGPFNRTRPQFNGTRPSMILSFVYLFNDQNDMVYLNDALFIKES